MGKLLRQPWCMGIVSAVLLDLPFPVAGPLPVWRNVVAWFALAPLLYALLHPQNQFERSYLRRSALGAYLCGVVWYLINCYWIYATMHIYGAIGAAASFGILLLYSLVLGLYFGLFGLLIALLAKAFRGVGVQLLLAPFLWAGIEFAASRITSVPWDQLGYAQVDNFLLTRLAPITGVYGISFVLVVGNALLAAAALAKSSQLTIRYGAGAVLFIVALEMGCAVHPAPEPAGSTAALVQQNLSVTDDNDWIGPEWQNHVEVFTSLSRQTCTPFFAGLPQTGAPWVEPQCPPQAASNITSNATSKTVSKAGPDLIAWPESPSPFRERDPRFRALMQTLARSTGATVISGNVAMEIGDGRGYIFNAASLISPEGDFVGRYDKIHLVPFGEYVPYKGLFRFAGTLTQGVGQFSRGTRRGVFASGGHRFGIFICYESVFADEVRHFARNGAEVLVNISDDGWYGDTSAPWQHLNMARMRAIENHRWILRDTNTGVTAAIDPRGRVTQSARRHVVTSLAARYGYRDDITFYTQYGDVFAKLCAIIGIAAVGIALARLFSARPNSGAISESTRQVSEARC